MLLRVKPPIRGRVFEVRNLEAGYIEREGRPEARLTWITTWPARCRIEYGAGDRTETVTEEEPAANHRVYLKHLHPGAEYRCRIVAPKPDGGSVESEDVTFTFSPPPPFEGGAKRADVPLRVENPHDFPVAAWRIRTIFPSRLVRSVPAFRLRRASSAMSSTCASWTRPARPFRCSPSR